MISLSGVRQIQEFNKKTTIFDPYNIRANHIIIVFSEVGFIDPLQKKNARYGRRATYLLGIIVSNKGIFFVRLGK
jgi:hypothetical protein